jgi:succinyl-CoA synthetase alpha subunit
MGILLTPASRVLVHNAVSPYARGMVEGMRGMGTNVVGGIAVGRAGLMHEGVPLFDTVAEAVATTDADTCILYTPAAGVADAVIENVDAGIKLLVIAAEYVAVHDAMRALAYARSRGVWVIGPNTVGIAVPGVGMLSGLSSNFGTPGPIGVMSRSGTVSLAVMHLLTRAGLGQSAVVNIGGDAVIGRNPAEYALLFDDDPATKVIVSVSELGGTKEYQLAETIPKLSKPLVAMVLGRYSPEQRRMGHAGAFASNEDETAEAKRKALRAAGAHIADNPFHLVELVRGILQRRGASASQRQAARAKP